MTGKYYDIHWLKAQGHRTGSWRIAKRRVSSVGNKTCCTMMSSVIMSSVIVSSVIVSSVIMSGVIMSGVTMSSVKLFSS